MTKRDPSHAGPAWATDSALANMRLWWPDLSISTAEIGRRLGTTKNAVVGKAHRLFFAPRPSPIIPRHERRETLPREVRGIINATVPPLQSLAIALPPEPAPVEMEMVAVPPPVAVLVNRQPVTVLPDRVTPPRPVAPPPPPQHSFARPGGQITACCWPIGEPGTREFRFCEQPSELGRSYCGAHCKVAYIRVRDRREDAREAL